MNEYTAKIEIERMSAGNKIALLNMRYDNNYGGNLQRYAMVTVLRRMGFEVDYLYIRDNWDDWFEYRSTSSIIKQSVKQIIRHLKHPKSEPWLVWHVEDENYRNSCSITEPFLEKYIPHTKPIYSHRELERVFSSGNYDVVVAGSDQIWRKQFVERYGLGTWYLDFVSKDFSGVRLVYGASFGVDNSEYSARDVELIKPLYERLTAVSVREKSGMRLLNDYGCDISRVEVVLDPTLLLKKDDYQYVISNTYTSSVNGGMFCYVLDKTPEMEEKIRVIAEKKQLTPHIMSAEGDNRVSIEQWLRFIMEADFVFTDSYHGLLFSLVFGKPFHLEYNSFRGNARFDSVIELLDINLANPNYELINERIDLFRRKSLGFLNESLSKNKHF